MLDQSATRRFQKICLVCIHHPPFALCPVLKESVNALTHVNYAFAFINPRSFQITTMDAATPSSLFDDMSDLKQQNNHLQVWLSIGGWTFSDNNTATQPVFGNIARSRTNREIFAKNLLNFLDTYGFDGVDIDW